MEAGAHRALPPTAKLGGVALGALLHFVSFLPFPSLAKASEAKHVSQWAQTPCTADQPALASTMAGPTIAPGLLRLRAEAPALSPCILTKNTQKIKRPEISFKLM